MSTVDQQQHQYSPSIKTGSFSMRSPHLNRVNNNNITDKSTSTPPPTRYSRTSSSDYVTGQFQSLSLGSRSVPHSGKMTSICQFFDQVFNLKDSETILQKSKDGQFYKTLQQDFNLKPQLPFPQAGGEGVKDALFTSIGPHLTIPFDIWLRDEICINDVKVKNTMLREINGMIEAELKDVENQSSSEVTLNYYGKLLKAYNFYEIPVRNSSHLVSEDGNRNGNGNGNGTLQEHFDEELEIRRDRMGSFTSNPDFDFGSLEKPFYRSHSNQSNDSQSHQNKRISASSMSSKKRFSSFLTGSGSGGHNNNKDGSNVSSSSPDLRDGNHRRSHLSTPTTPPQPHFRQFSTSSSSSTSTPASYSTPTSSSPPSHYFQQQQQQQSQQFRHDGSPTPKSHLFEDPNGTPTSSHNSMSVNNLLSKSRLYNRMKKHRESASSVNTNSSHQSYPSNRSSITTAASGGAGSSSGGSRRRSSVTTNVKHLFGTNGNNNGGGGSGSNSVNGDVSSFDSSRTLMPTESYPPSPFDNLALTKEEKLENNKDKHEYYNAVTQLMRESRRILQILFNSNNNNNNNKDTSKLAKLIDFITTKVFKFILIDVFTMVLTYCDLKCCNFRNI
ncbi:hypothetical protein CANMA_000794 [Candida margitis]|uniref:uncharacterized protein n=1 Tax=Candida margitis TaxID=1775924 RepID=UPI00222726BD|nr:uncharacterized protein CANMA_000794 [Candida margitis]KAI5970183.1 hypothetical protein CANMA_000794 [Candida margitis]